MKLHILTIGSPKLAYAKLGFEEYAGRLGKLQQLRTTHLADKYAHNAKKILEAARQAYTVALVIDGGRELSSHQLARFLQDQELEAREVCFLIGGPDGLPPEVVAAADFRWSLSPLTFPHDLAVVIVAEALYRAGSINAGHPYHH